MPLFEYAIIVNEKRDKDNNIVEDAKIAVGVTPVVARDIQQATMLASRQIPEAYTSADALDRVVVAVRPF